MLLTEAEYRTKQCRQAPPIAGRPVGSIATPQGQAAGGMEIIFAPCVASNCAHWRFGEPLYEDRDVGNEDPRLPPRPPEGEGWERVCVSAGDGARLVWRRQIALRGYCGLAGPPT
jgi:hypothetical protein